MKLVKHDVVLERELQDELLSAQRDIQVLERDWMARFDQQDAEANARLQLVKEETEAVIRSLMLAKEEGLANEVALEESQRETESMRGEVAGLKQLLLKGEQEKLTKRRRTRADPDEA